MANINWTRKTDQVPISTFYIVLQNVYANYNHDLDKNACVLLFDSGAVSLIWRVTVSNTIMIKLCPFIKHLWSYAAPNNNENQNFNANNNLIIQFFRFV